MIESNRAEIQRIEAKLAKANRTYYEVGEASTMSDDEYDALATSLLALAPDHPMLQQIGTTPRKNRVKLGQRMYSLDKAKGSEGWDKWVSRRRDGEIYVVSPKMDGCALSLRYDRTPGGRIWALAQATTRGDGEVGEDVTVQVINGDIDGIPQFVHGHKADAFILQPEQFWVSGEAVIRKSTLRMLNLARKLADQEPYKNARNLVNGTLGLDNVTAVKARKVCFFAYGTSLDYTTVRLFGDYPHLEFLSGVYGLLADLGFGVVKHWVGDRHYVAYFFTGFCKDQKTFPFEVDGVVVAINSSLIRAHMGYTSHHPKWAVAIKFPDETTVVTVKRIEWTLSKYGALTPQAIYDPVNLGGAELERVTLHNAQQIIDKKIAIGSRLAIRRSGGVIPWVAEVVETGPNGPEIPLRCPACEGFVDWEGLELHCQNPECLGKLAQSLEFFLAKIEFKGIGEKICEQLVEANVVKGWADLWRLSASTFMTVLGWKNDHAEEIAQGLREIKRDVPFEKLLQAFQVRGLGKTASRKIAQKYGDIIALRADDAAYTWFTNLGANIGPGIYVDLMNRIDSGIWEALQQAGFTIKSPVQLTADALKIVITGKLSKGRKEYQELIEAAGHEFSGSLSKDTDVLVVGENVGAGKTAKAERYGTRLEDEQWLVSFLAGTLQD